MKREEIRIRDPFIWTDKENQCYYMYGTTACVKDGISAGAEWRHGESRFDFDGGHAMLFNTLDGKRMISLHRPNTANFERAHFYEFN